jgi:hypothetical protein
LSNASFEQPDRRFDIASRHATGTRTPKLDLSG